MDLRSAARIVLRHWILVQIGLMATVGAAVFTSQQVVPVYEAKGSVVILPPASVGDGIQNPYTRFDSSSATTAVTLMAVVNGQAFKQQLTYVGITGTYEVRIDPSSGGSIVDLVVTTGAPRTALDQWDLLRKELQRELFNRQTATGAPSSSFITASSLVTPVSATAVSGRADRVTIAVAVLGAVLAISMAFVADGLRAGRPRRWTRKRDDVGDETEPESKQKPHETRPAATPHPAAKSARPGNKGRPVPQRGGSKETGKPRTPAARSSGAPR